MTPSFSTGHSALIHRVGANDGLHRLLAQRALPDVITADPDEPLQRVIVRLQAHRISQMPVVSDGGHLLGLVTEADLLDRVRNPRHLADLDAPVSSVMRAHPPTVSPDASLEQALRLGAGGDPIVVLDGERVVGLITPIDILDYLTSSATAESE